MNEATKERVRAIIKLRMDGILERRIKELPTKMENLHLNNPFGSRLIPDEIWKASWFERSFVTSFGQGVYEQVAREIALGTGATAVTQHKETVTINQFQDTAINELLDDQRKNRSSGSPSWQEEVEKVSALQTRNVVNHDILFDLYVKRPDGTEEYYSLKTVQPNLDQTEIAKREMLRVVAAKSNAKAYLAFYYNPYGEENLYTRQQGKKLFDWNECPAVLIGSEFWNTVGQSPDTFNQFIAILDELSEEYVGKIRKEYLGL
ncbi:MAG: TdeIII family type II restriction endonuclease [Turicibacter sp.]|nr:TdeIII family type II restriction endonuclease [Turicibacter sp.]